MNSSTMNCIKKAFSCAIYSKSACINVKNYFSAFHCSYRIAICFINIYIACTVNNNSCVTIRQNSVIAIK